MQAIKLRQEPIREISNGNEEAKAALSFCVKQNMR